MIAWESGDISPDDDDEDEEDLYFWKMPAVFILFTSWLGCIILMLSVYLPLPFYAQFLAFVMLLALGL